MALDEPKPPRCSCDHPALLLDAQERIPNVDPVIAHQAVRRISAIPTHDRSHVERVTLIACRMALYLDRSRP